MATVLLLLPVETYRASDFLTAARRLDIEVVVASTRRQTLDWLMGQRALTLQLSDPHQAARRIVEHAAQVPLDAVVAVDDQGVVATAIAAAQLGLAHNPPEAVAATRDKALLRTRLTEAGLRQPRFRVLAGDDDVSSAVRDVGQPCVLKPVGMSGSRGVIRADDLDQATDAARRIRALLCDHADDRVIVETFVAGVEVAVEGLLRAGELETLAVFDKPDPLDGPYFEETLYVTPSRLPADRRERIVRITAEAARALGLREGPIHAELRVDGDEVTLLELAARSIGGLCARSLRFGLGVSLEEIILRHAIGLPTDGLGREHAASGVMMLPIPRAGVLRGVSGQDKARAVPQITGLEITVPIGERVVPLPDGDRYLGFVFARGFTPEQVEASLREAHAMLEFDIDDPTG